MTHSRMFREWSARIDGGTFTHAQCRAFAKTVVGIAEDGTVPTKWNGRRASSLTVPEARELVLRVRRDGVGLEAEHTAAGLAWIGGRGIRDAFPAWVLEDFDRFTYQGYAHRLRNGLGEVAHRIPVWRVHGKGGQVLDYYAASWQSGSGYGPTIIRQTTSAS